MDDEFCRERVKTVRILAEQAEPLKHLLQLADHYDRRINPPKDNQSDGRSEAPPR